MKLLLPFSFSLLLAACGRPEPHPQATSTAAPVPVTTVAAAPSDWPDTYEATAQILIRRGKVQAVQDIPILRQQEEVGSEVDILLSIAEGQDPDSELVSDHLTEGLISAAPDWSLERAAQAMIDGGFRHLLVIDGAEIVGVLSMRDIVRCWNGGRVASGTS